MRPIGTLETESQAYNFYSFLMKEGIQNIYEIDPESKRKQYRIWVCDEDNLQVASDWLDLYKKNPGDPKFQGFNTPIAAAATPPPPDYAEISRSEDLKWQSVPPRSAMKVRVRRFSLTLTNLIIVLCAFLFLWNSAEEEKIIKEKGEIAAEIALTPMDKQLFFDYPAYYTYIEQLIDTVPLNNYKEKKTLPPEAVALIKKAEEAPAWRGLYSFIVSIRKQGWESAKEVPLFEKISQGEIWRLFSPCLLHANFLHILFNMIWVWILSSQIEARMHKWKLVLMILIIGVISNVIQYLVSGPYFLGFSGVIVGMAGFIWMRQRKAPWEGYPLQKSTLIFLLLFVIAMLIIELFTFGLRLFSTLELTPQIANTAHIVGGLIGILLGRFSFFKRRMT